MKKVLATLLCLTLLLSAAACSAGVPQVSEPTESTEATLPGAEIFTDELKADLDAILEQNKYEGIVYLTYQGEPVYESVSGTNDLGEPLTIESPMYIASISKQFCAAAILMLRDQGKLSLNDPLEKYFPEYTIGKDITLKNLLAMRSGIIRDPLPLLTDPESYMDNTTEENIAAMKEWTFSQPLNFAPDSKMEYSNLNYNLLSFVVEIVSGQSYTDFIRQNIFEPLGMTHSGFIGEVRDTPEWTQGLTYDNLDPTAQLAGICQGCGEITTTAGDLDIWMTALQSGKVVSMESFREMTTDYSPEDIRTNYGYGLMRDIRGGWGHGGTIPSYTSYMYFNEEYGYNFYIVTGNTSSYRLDITTQTSTAFLRTLFEAVDAASANE